MLVFSFCPENEDGMLLRNVGTFRSKRLNIPEESESSPVRVVFSDAGSAVCLKREFIATCADLIRDQKTTVDSLSVGFIATAVCFVVNSPSDTQLSLRLLL